MKGEKKGTSETFAENLPGLTDNIHLHAPSQTFWLGVVGVRKLIFIQLARFVVLISLTVLEHDSHICWNENFIARRM